MTAVRQFPMPVFAKPSAWGRCKWCGHDVKHVTGKRVGEVNMRRTWHADCLHAWRLHTDRAVQYRHVAARDGERCHVCQEAPMKWLRGGVARRLAACGTYVERYCSIERVIELHLDHATPLWLVAELDGDARRPYFGPGNLQLLCRACHAEKTRGEATLRGRANRQAKMGDKRPKSRMASRGFQKGVRRSLASRPW
jgi:hypothetical protein